MSNYIFREIYSDLLKTEKSEYFAKLLNICAQVFNPRDGGGGGGGSE